MGAADTVKGSIIVMKMTKLTFADCCFAEFERISEVSLLDSEL